MKKVFSCTLFFGLASLIGYGSAIAQIAPDTSVPTSVTSPNGLNFTIDNGAVSGNNLFHSFREFSVPTNGSAFFNNAANVQNIFSRVTGGNISNIDGLIRANGGANLFLLNPAGIVFGLNAQLNIGGSFVGTTANSIRFADGVEFSAINPTATPLLTISVPIGLHLGANPGAIQVQGLGHSLRTNGVVNSLPIVGAGINPSGLQVKPGNTLALVGGDVTFAGGILSASQGQLELGAGANGSVSLNTTAQGLALGWEGVQNLRDIRLAGRSLLDASGAGGGNIQLTGRQVTLLDGSIALIQNSGTQSAGTIGLNAAEKVEISGFSPDNQANTALISETLVGKGADIAIVTGQLVDRGLIRMRAFNESTGGNLNIRAADSVELDAAVSDIPSNGTGIIAGAYQSSQAGNITVITNRLNVLNGAIITSSTFGTGNAGNIFINAREAIKVMGFSPDPPRSSLITASSFGAGNAGTIALNTARLNLENGSVISTSFSGNSGTITVNATEAIEIDGSFQQDPLLQTRITSGVFILPQDLTMSSALPTGASGNITLNTPQLSLTNGGSVRVSNLGTGNGGTIRIQADSLSLAGQGSITASSRSGEGGNITLRSENLQLRYNSDITATAGGTGNGGNLSIDAPIIVGLENSDITANAFQGKGGNIQITTEGIFLAPDSDITASSQLGISGTVSISNLNLQPENLVFLPTNTFVNQAPVIASSCLTDRNAQQGRFVATGNGGLSETPDHTLMLYEVARVRNVGQLRASGNRSPETTNSRQPDRPIQEATGFVFTPEGKVVLVVDRGKIASPPELTCTN